MSKSKIKRLLLLLCIGIGLLAGNANGNPKALAVSTTTKAISQGVAARINGVRPRPLDMVGPPPAGIKKLPASLSSPLYGVLTLGPQEAPTRFITIVEEGREGEPRLWIDANANGDLTDDAPVVWKKFPYQTFDGKPLTRYESSVVLQVRYGTRIEPLHLNILRYDPKDPNREGYRNSLLFIADYARETEILLGAHSYHAMLYDTFTLGDFRGKPDMSNTGVSLMIDVNGNGQFDARGESYDAGRPFNIKGVTYELSNMTPDGSAFMVVKSRFNAPEILPPPDLRVGQPVLPFTQKLLDGKPVHFPTDYKGKLVMLYFWASWCPDCQAQIPTVRDAYQQFHGKGLDILGVSVDPATLPIPLKKYVKLSSMPWPQVYEGKFWESELVKKYFIGNIPAPFLVDGDTGKILAEGSDLKGANLAVTLQKALANRKTK